MFANRLRKNLQTLGRWSRREGVDCYRLYDADMPEYAVAVDWYQGWVHVQEYAPPPSVDALQARRRLRDERSGPHRDDALGSVRRDGVDDEVGRGAMHLDRDLAATRHGHEVRDGLTFDEVHVRSTG